MDTSKKEEQIFERIDLDDKKEELFQENIKTNRKKRIISVFISLSIFVVVCLTIFLVLFFIKHGNEVTNQESVAQKGNYENKIDIEEDNKEKEILCNIGKNELCLTCEKEKCGSCNPGYKLKDGKCIFIYSFKATYESTKTHQFTYIFSIDFSSNFKKINILNIQMNGKNYNYKYTTTNNVRDYFPFPDVGKYELFVLVDISNITSLKNAFMMSNLISISFTEEFKTENITSMDNIFRGSSIKRSKYVLFEC